MEPRLNYYPKMPEGFAKLVEMGSIAQEGLQDNLLYHLIKIRASQLNGCTFCVDMHVKEAKIDNERELRLHHIAVWKDSPLFSAREKAALRWTEALTELSHESASDAVYAEVREHFNEKEIVALTMAITAINSWNRFSVAFRSVPGALDKAYGLDKAGL